MVLFQTTTQKNKKQIKRSVENTTARPKFYVFEKKNKNKIYIINQSIKQSIKINLKEPGPPLIRTLSRAECTFKYFVEVA